MIRGTSHDQDSRFPDKNKRMLENSIWPDQYDIKIDLSKVDYQLIKIWIGRKLQQLMGVEDEIAIGTVISLLDQCREKEEKPKAKNVHIAMSGLLQQKTLTFIMALWEILDDAQKSNRGIPEILIEQKRKQQEEEKAKKEEIQRKKDKLKGYRFKEVIDKYIPKKRDRSRENKSRHNDYSNRNRSQDKDKERKKQKHDYSQQKHKRKHRNQGKSRSRSNQNRKSKKKNNDKKHKNKRHQTPSSSESSSVVSSSNSHQ